MSFNFNCIMFVFSPISAKALSILAAKAAAVQGAVGLAAKGAAVGGAIFNTKAAALNSIASLPIPYAVSTLSFRIICTSCHFFKLLIPYTILCET